MIQANELRVGNILQYYIGEDGCEWDDTKIDAQDILWCQDKNDNFNKVHRAVKLTPEWMLNNGFWRDSDAEQFLGEEIYTNGEVQINSDGIFYNGIFSQDVEFVHEFQNLYYSLFKVELPL